MRLRPIDPWEITAVRLALEAAGVAALVVLVLWPFRLYGFDLVDEGTQLVQLERAAAGERPYLDFETGYTPGYFAIGGSLLEAGAGSIVTIRTFGVVWQGVLVAGLWATLRAWAGAPLASAVALLYVAFLLPVSLRTGAPFNIPYPGWLAAGAALAVQVMVSRVSARRIRRRSLLLLATGAIAGVAFSLKPNSGLLILAGALLGFVPTWASGSALNRGLAASVRLLAVVATALLLAPGLGQGYAVPLLLPVVVAALRAGPAFEDGDGALRHVLLLSLGFAVVVGPWLLPLIEELGVMGALRTVLLFDGGVVAAYLMPFSAPMGSTIVLALGAVGAHATRKRPEWLPVLLGTTLLVATAFAIPVGPRLAAENALLWIGPISILVGLLDREALERYPRERAALLFASIYALQLFPRPDSFHVAMGGAPLALAVGLVWRRYGRLWRAGVDPQASSTRWAPRLILAGFAVVALGRMAPAWLPAVTEPRVDAGLGPRAPVEVVERHAGHYARAARLVAEVRDRTDAGADVFLFPDIAGVGFLADRRQPYHYLYFVPGRPDRGGEADAIARLGEVAPTTLVTCPPLVPAFADAPEYFSRLGEAVNRAYAPAVDVDGCTVWSRRSTSR